GDDQPVLARVHLALEHGPVIRVLPGEVRPSGMAEQHLQATPPAPQQDARTDAAGLIDLRLSGACHRGDDGSCAQIAQGCNWLGTRCDEHRAPRSSGTSGTSAAIIPKDPQLTASTHRPEREPRQRGKDAVGDRSSRIRPAKDWETSRNDGNGWGNEPAGREADLGIAAVSEVGLENTLKVETRGSNPVGTTSAKLQVRTLVLTGSPR